MMQLTKSAEWYTPPTVIAAARLVLGEIDLDPASSEAANSIIRARRFYTQEENGLLQDWTASTLWLNPPYGRTVRMAAQRKSTIALFVEKLLAIYQQGSIGAAILLATTEVNAKWFYPLWQFPICFPASRIKFIVPGGTERGIYTQMFGTCFVYLGPHPDRFTEVFGTRFGVVKAGSAVPSRPTTYSLWPD